MTKDYIFEDIQKKWKEIEKNRLRVDNIEDYKDYNYIIPMFPYPSGTSHLGHGRVFTISDIITKYKYLKGEKVINCIGFDSFGLPAEIAAIEKGIDPKVWTERNSEQMLETFQELGYMFDYSRLIYTHKENYFLETQKLFLILYRNGYIYEKEDVVNYDPISNTVLANEQIDSEGKCWRTGANVEYKILKQWYLKISEVAKDLNEGLTKLEKQWSSCVIKMQKDRLRLSKGSKIKFKYKDIDIECFTTQPHTVYGVTFLLVSNKSYIKQKIDNRQLEEGTIIGEAYNSYNKKHIPICISDYVISDYGTGVVMGCPALDIRDKKFAIKYKLPIIEIISEDNKMINSDYLNGLTEEEALNKQSSILGTVYQSNLRDWCISRQRAWGCRIPLIFCKNCGTVENPNLPVRLPDNIIFSEGNPLDKIDLSCKCPKCHLPAKESNETLDTFFDSSFYFINYISKDLSKSIPVNYYAGGKEHATMHLLYARGIIKILNKLNLVKYDEPFINFIANGLVCLQELRGSITNKYYSIYDTEVIKGKLYSKENKEEVLLGETSKMSKSKNNVISLSLEVKKIGSDAMKLSLMEDRPIDVDMVYDQKKALCSLVFLKRLWKIVIKLKDYEEEVVDSEEVTNLTKSMGTNIISYKHNLYVSGIRTLFNYIKGLSNPNQQKYLFKKLLIVIWPICTFISNELLEEVYDTKIDNYTKWPDDKEIEEEIEDRMYSIYINKELITKVFLEDKIQTDKLKEYKSEEYNIEVDDTNKKIFIIKK